MSSPLSLRAHGSSQLPILDTIGIGSLVAATIWTLSVFSALVWILHNMHIRPIRLLNLHVLFWSVIILHGFWLVNVLAYPLMGPMSCAMEFWLMSLVLPIGVMLYQFHNFDVLALIMGYRTNTEDDPLYYQDRGFRGILRRWERYWLAPPVIRAAELVFLLLMILWQFPISLVNYLTSNKFQEHGLWSSFGNEFECRRGLEWFPAIFWPSAWGLIVLPWALCTHRGLPEIQSWRPQTIWSLLAVMYSVVLWVVKVAARKPDDSELDSFWGSTLWFLPLVTVLEAAALYLPLQTISYMRKFLRLCAQNHTVVEPLETPPLSPTSPRADLNAVIDGDMSAILSFVLTKDYSAENILFLRHVRNWKANWERFSADHDNPESLRRHMFTHAVEIYSTYVSLRTANFPVNIEAAISSALDNIFSEATQLSASGDSGNLITPFDSVIDTSQGNNSEPAIPLRNLGRQSSSSSRPRRAPSMTENASSEMVERYVEVILADLKKIEERPSSMPEAFTIPEAFDKDVFEEAERSVMNLVLRDTWPKFLRSEGRHEAGRATESA
ncbi:hypothetical protein DIZ76_016201 [Coccidioides immitis]|nr:hypothetical protein DIZ76_016201 [Coccidioides immitis]